MHDKRTKKPKSLSTVLLSKMNVSTYKRSLNNRKTNALTSVLSKEKGDKIVADESSAFFLILRKVSVDIACVNWAISVEIQQCQPV